MKIPKNFMLRKMHMMTEWKINNGSHEKVCVCENKRKRGEKFCQEFKISLDECVSVWLKANFFPISILSHQTVLCVCILGSKSSTCEK